jgi:hypothetical protein
MDSIFREEPVALEQRVGGLKNIVRRDLVADVNNLNLGVNVEDNTLHHPYVVVCRAEVRD